MKRIFVAFVNIMIISTAIGQQQPENPGFEQWESVGLTVDEPVNWSSIKTSDNSFLNGLAPYVWDKSTDAHSGAFSLKLYNASVLTIVAAGAITNGRVHSDLNPENGYMFTDINNSQWNTPFTKKPDSLVVWAKYNSVSGDVAQAKAVLHTGTARIPDAAMTNWIALAEINISSSTAGWTRFSAPFNYFNTTTPAYILFVCNAAGTAAHVGTVAYFDDIELIYNPITVDLAVFLEGPYAGSSQMSTMLNPNHLPLYQPFNTAPWNYAGSEYVSSIPSADVVDWCLIEIRDALTADLATSFATKGRQAGFVLKNGKIVGMDGLSRLSFDAYINTNLFVIVWHRNHLGAMSAYPLTKTNGIYAYNFSNGADKIYGGSDGNVQLEIFGMGLWGMVAGDGDADGEIDITDKTGFWSILAGKTGYLAADYNLDGQTNNPDKNGIWLKNYNRVTQVPD